MQKLTNEIGIKTHLVCSGIDIYNFIPRGEYPADFHHKALIVRRLDMIPVEFIFRNRMAGSLWKNFYSKGLSNPYDLDLPDGLQLMSPFEHAVFTPTEKSETDDELNSLETAQKYHSAFKIAKLSYYHCHVFADSRGIDMIDTKVELGLDSHGEIRLGDECFTPDSSRFVDADEITIGTEPIWFDKQLLRNEAERMWNTGTKVPLTFSDEICNETQSQYHRIFEMIVGTSLSNYQTSQQIK
jgi:phosphoribosylaminoimidazole-succinocarboxamide synthase